MRYLYKVHAMPCFLVTSRRGAFLAMCLHGYILLTPNIAAAKGSVIHRSPQMVWTSKIRANLEPCDLLESSKNIPDFTHDSSRTVVRSE